MVNKGIEVQPVGCYCSKPRSTMTDLDSLTPTACGMGSAQARRIAQSLAALNPEGRAMKVVIHDSNTIMLEGVTLQFCASGVATPRLKTRSLASLYAQPCPFRRATLTLWTHDLAAC